MLNLTKQIVKFSLPVLFSFALLPALPAAAPAARTALQKQDIALMQRMLDYAHDAQDAADRIGTYSRVPDESSRASHVYQLEVLKDAMNSMAPVAERLAATRNELDDADRKAVTRIVIAAVELAQNANAAILKANSTEQTPSLIADYRKLIEVCYRDASDLVKALGAGMIELK